MMNYLYFRTEAALADDDGSGNSVCFPASHLTGFEPASDTTLKIAFKSMNNVHAHDDHTISDTVVVTLPANTHKTAIEAIISAANAPINQGGFVVVGDDATGDYLGGITAVEGITVDAAHS